MKIQVQKNTSEPFLTMVINPEFQCVEEHHNCWKLPLSLLLHELLEKALSPCGKILLTNRLSSCGASRTGTIRYAYLGQFGNTVGAAVGCSRVSFSGMAITFLVLSLVYDAALTKLETSKCFSHTLSELQFVGLQYMPNCRKKFLSFACCVRNGHYLEKVISKQQIEMLNITTGYFVRGIS